MIGKQRRTFGDLLGRRKKYCSLVAEIYVHAGFVLQFVNELGIHASAGGGQGLKGCRSFQGEVGQHAGGGMRGFLSGFSAFHDQDGGAALPQRDREREPDNSAADDDDVPAFHRSIVKQCEDSPGEATAA